MMGKIPYIHYIYNRLVPKKQNGRNTKYVLLTIILIAMIVLVAYANSLSSEFAVIDDYSTIVENPDIYNLSKQLKSNDLLSIFNSLIVNIFGINPLPFRIISITLHILSAILLYVIILLISKNRWISTISVILFVLHPINTEAVSWISAATYLHISIFTYVTLILYILFKQKKNRLYYVLSLGFYTIFVLFYQTPWLIIIPIVLFIIDQFLLEEKFSAKSIIYVGAFIIPLLLFYIPNINETYTNRIDGREGENPSKRLINEQKLTPVTESYAYTTYTMLKQYVLPIHLSIYYDGNAITKNDLGIMYIVFAIYIILCIYTFKKSRKIAGLLLLLPALILPTYSPIKITWFMAERYLYLGTGVYTTLIAVFLYKTLLPRYKILTYLVIILISSFYLIKTINRNSNWHTPITLAKATIIESPRSVRPYNDLGYYYLYNKDYKESIIQYNKALEIDPNSATAIHNLGYIYINNGIPILYNTPVIANTEEKKEERISIIQTNLDAAKILMTNKEDQKAMYFVNEALKQDPNHFDSLAIAGEIYARSNKIQFALDIYNRIIKLEGESPDLIFILSYLHYMNKDYDESLNMLEKLKGMDPNYPNLEKSLENVKMQVTQEALTN